MKCLHVVKQMLAAWAAVFLMSAAPCAHAATFNIANGDVAALKSALTTANTNGQTDIINLAAGGTYTLTTLDNSDFGDNGLPIIANDASGADLTINGNGATIQRSAAANTPQFRILQTGSASQVVINDLTLTGGDANASDFQENSGGGVLNYHGVLTLNGCSITNNSGQYAGGIFNDSVFSGSATLVMLNCTVSGNSSVNDGGGIYNGGFGGNAILTATDCTISNNSSPSSSGGGIYNDGLSGIANLTVTSCTLANNTAGAGAGISNAGTLTVNTCLITGNSTSTDFEGGAGIRNTNTAAIDKTTISGNTAGGTSGGGGGGGIYNKGGTLTVTNSTISDNASNGEAGAGLISYGNIGVATATLTNCTISGNKASGNFTAGGIDSTAYDFDATLTLIHCTIANNTNSASQDVSGGLYDGKFSSAASTVTLKNTIIANNSAPNVFRTNSGEALTSQGYNLCSDGTANLTQATDQPNTDPKLGPLADNGGPTKTQALLADSPAIDKGKSFGIAADQRGQTRPHDDASIANAAGGDGSDIGAFEDQINHAPTLSINDVAKAEGDSGTSNLTFTVTLSSSSAQDVYVYYATANGTATAGSDYIETSSQTVPPPNSVLVIPAGQTTGTLNVPIIGDMMFEPNETFTLTLSNATNATIAKAQGTGTIINDDTVVQPTLSINNVSKAEGPAQGAPAGTSNLTFTVTLSTASTQDVTVQYATANGTGTAPADYTATSGTLTIAAGQTTGTINVPIVGDTVPESNDTFYVNLSNPTKSTISASQGIGTIRNDDVGPSLSINNVTVIEGNSGTTNATFTITLSASSTQTVSVNAIPYNGSARSPFDYTSGGAHLVFNPGETVKTFSVPVIGDLLDEPTENFFVILSSSINATLAHGRGVGTITDDDAAPTISIDDVRIGEGNFAQGAPSQRTAAFRLKLSAPSGQIVKVNYSTIGDSATAGEDFVAVAPTQIAFTTGNLYAYARVLINGDTLNEADETFFVNLSGAIGATIADSQAIGTILNDDATPALSINDVRITEGNPAQGAPGTKNLTFTVTLSAPSSNVISVNYNTADGTAKSTSDYAATNGSLVFAAGTTTRTINVIINGDIQVEGDETLFVLLSGAANANVSKARGSGTILNDDASG